MRPIQYGRKCTKLVKRSSRQAAKARPSREGVFHGEKLLLGKT